MFANVPGLRGDHKDMKHLEPQEEYPIDEEAEYTNLSELSLHQPNSPYLRSQPSLPNPNYYGMRPTPPTQPYQGYHQMDGYQRQYPPHYAHAPGLGYSCFYSGTLTIHLDITLLYTQDLQDTSHRVFLTLTMLDLPPTGLVATICPSLCQVILRKGTMAITSLISTTTMATLLKRILDPTGTTTMVILGEYRTTMATMGILSQIVTFQATTKKLLVA